MNYRYLLSLFFMALSLSIWAERIPESTARQVAQQVLSGFNPLRATVSPVLAYQAPNNLRAGDGSDYYIYTPDQGTGFVIVSGNDLAYPVLGYSTTDPFQADNMPAPMLEWLENYQQELAHIENYTASESVARQWASVLRGELRLETGKVLDTPKWRQSDPFNRMTPQIDGQQTLVGCVALAMGIVMAYHQYPEKVIHAPVTNQIFVNNNRTTVQVDYSQPYDWDNILPSYLIGQYTDTQAMEVSRLLYHCGVNVEMSYGIKVSGASSSHVPKVLRDVFGYSPSIQYAEKRLMSWDSWKKLLRDDIDNGLPVMYSGHDQNTGHAFVCDGYSGDFFHFNWGWGGYCDGYFLLTALTPDGDNYSSEQTATFHIKPTMDAEKADPIFTVSGADYTTDGTSIRAKCTVHYSGLDDMNYKTGLGVIDSQNQIIQNPSNDIFSHVYEIFTGTIRSYTIELDRRLNAGEKVVMLGSADGQNWIVLPTAPGVPIGVGPDGVITAPSDDPDEPDDDEMPVEIRIVRDGIEREHYAAVGGFDNDQRANDNVIFTNYQLNRPVPVYFTYTISNFEQWKGKLKIYSGQGSELYNANEGEPVTIDADGTFTVRAPALTTSSIQLYSQGLKIFASDRGKLELSITATPEGYEQPHYRASGGFILFLEKAITSWESVQVRGKVGEKIILKPTLSNLDPYFENEDVQLQINIWDYSMDDYELFRSDGEPVTMKSYSSNPLRAYSTDPVLIWEKGQRKYHFVLIPKATAAENTVPTIFTAPYYQGKALPSTNYAGGLFIEPGTSANEVIEDPSIRLSSEPGALVLHLEQDATVAIYTMEGKQVNLAQRSAGDHRIPLAKGCYLVQINGQIYKIIL